MANRYTDPTPDTAWRPLFRAGAVAAGIAVALYVAALVLFVVTDAPPEDPTGAEMLAFVDEHRSVYLVKQALWLVPSVFMMLVSIALAVATWRLGRSLALVAGVVATVSWALSLAWPTTGEGSPAMVLLSDRWVEAGAAGRVTLEGAAETLMALNDVASPLGVLQAVGVLLLGLLMRRGVFPPALGWLGVVTGALGIAGELFRVQLGWAYAIYGVLLFAWLVWVAVALWRLGTERE
jgi:hypothetical protein